MLVKDRLDISQPACEWITNIYEYKMTPLWSMYATDLYLRLKGKAVREGWISKLRYLLYENNITAYDAQKYSDMEGLLLQSKPGAESLSRHSVFSEMQILVQNVKASSIRELYAIEAMEVN